MLEQLPSGDFYATLKGSLGHCGHTMQQVCATPLQRCNRGCMPQLLHANFLGTIYIRLQARAQLLGHLVKCT